VLETLLEILLDIVEIAVLLPKKAYERRIKRKNDPNP